MHLTSFFSKPLPHVTICVLIIDTRSPLPEDFVKCLPTASVRQHPSSHKRECGAGRPHGAVVIGILGSEAPVSKCLIALDLYFVREVQLDNGACTKGSQPLLTCPPSRHLPASLGQVLGHLLLYFMTLWTPINLPLPTPTQQLCCR